VFAFCILFLLATTVLKARVKTYIYFRNCYSKYQITARHIIVIAMASPRDLFGELSHEEMVSDVTDSLIRSLAADYGIDGSDELRFVSLNSEPHNSHTRVIIRHRIRDLRFTSTFHQFGYACLRINETHNCETSSTKRFEAVTFGRHRPTQETCTISKQKRVDRCLFHSNNMECEKGDMPCASVIKEVNLILDSEKSQSLMTRVDLSIFPNLANCPMVIRVDRECDDRIIIIRAHGRVRYSKIEYQN
jgi:hypothetical protein